MITQVKHKINTNSLNQSACCNNILSSKPKLSLLQVDTLSFSGKRLQVKLGRVSRELRKEINRKDKEQIGNGHKGKAYLIKANGQDLVLKVALNPDISFEKEASILNKLPKSLPNAQHLVAYAYDPKLKKDILVTKLVKGEETNPDGTVLNDGQLASMMNTLLENDKAGVLHNDVSPGNWLIDGDDITLIDYEYGSLIDIEKGDESTPPFMVPSNINCYERQGLYTTLLNLKDNGKDLRPFFTEFLKQKGAFHENRIEYLSGLDQENPVVQESADYEAVLAKVLKEPSDDVIKLESKKLQFFYTFMEANRGTFLRKPIQTAKNWTTALCFGRKYKDAIVEKLNDPAIAENPDMQKYLEYQNRYADFYLETFNDWATGTISWIFNVLAGKQEFKEMLDNGLKDPFGAERIEVGYTPEKAQDPPLIDFTELLAPQE